MAKESTAIASLLELAARRPIERQSDDDLLFAMPVAEKKRTNRRRETGSRQPATIAPPVVVAPAPAPDTRQLTHRISRPRDYRKPVLAGAMVTGGLAIGLTLWKLASGGSTAIAAAAVVKPVAEPPALVAAAPPPKIVVEPLPPTAPPPRPALVDIALESKPPGATVTLVDRGNSQIAGSTPLALSIDPSRQYDVTFALDGQAPKSVHLDPKTMKRLTVELAVVEPEPLPAPAPPRVQARAAAPHRTAAAVTGSGTLMISTKPPCDIAIDGKATGLTSPQRSIAVAAGPHQVTLTNSQQHIKKTVAVDVAPDHATKLIRDLMKK